MDLILNVKFNKRPEPNDILVFNGKEWVNMTKKEFLIELIGEIKNIKDTIKDLDELKREVKELRGEDDE